MNRDQKLGALQEIKGRLKQALGVLGDEDGASEGGAERATSVVKTTVTDLDEDVTQKLDQ